MDNATVIATVESHANSIRSRYGWMLRKISHRFDKDDLVKAVFVKALKSKCNAETLEQAEHWIFTIARNVALAALDSHLTCKKRSVKAESSEAESEDGPQSRLFTIAVNDKPTIDSVIEKEDVQRYLSFLPERQRQAVQLRFINDKTFIEVGEEMKISSLAARLLTHRAIEKMKKIAECEVNQN